MYQDKTMTRVPIAFRLNGEDVEVLVKPWQTLLEVLRDELHLTGSKEGCGNGNCGACTVQFDGKVIDSCLTLGIEADSHDVLTIEGLDNAGKLHPIQQAFVDYSGLQCGFCTPGFIMATKALLESNPHPTEREIRAGIAGNLCRCTGYDKIVKAIQAVVSKET